MEFGYLAVCAYTAYTLSQKELHLDVVKSIRGPPGRYAEMQ
jgi:hypothetical protein